MLNDAKKLIIVASEKGNDTVKHYVKDYDFRVGSRYQPIWTVHFTDEISEALDFSNMSEKEQRAELDNLNTLPKFYDKYSFEYKTVASDFASLLDNGGVLISPAGLTYEKRSVIKELKQLASYHGGTYYPEKRPYVSFTTNEDFEAALADARTDPHFDKDWIWTIITNTEDGCESVDCTL